MPVGRREFVDVPSAHKSGLFLQLGTYCDLSTLTQGNLLGKKGVTKVSKLSDTDACIVIYRDLGREVYDNKSMNQDLREKTNQASRELANWSSAQLFHGVCFFNFDAGDEYDRNDKGLPFVYGKRYHKLWRIRKEFDVHEDGRVAWKDPEHNTQLFVNAVDGVRIQETAAKREIEAAVRANNVGDAQRVSEYPTCSARLKEFASLEEETLSKEFSSKMPLVYTHIPVWDYILPTESQLEEFAKVFNAKQDNSLVVMHCASGSGRSSTFAYMARLCELVAREPHKFRGSSVTDVEKTLSAKIIPLYPDGKDELILTHGRVQAFCTNAAEALNNTMSAGIMIEPNEYM